MPTVATSRQRPLFVVISLVFAILATVLPTQPAGAVTAASVLEQQLFDQLNNERAARGLSPLERAGWLDDASVSWSNSMSSSHNLHHSSDGRAEIIARGWWTGQITDAWMRSDGHRNLVVDPNLGSAGVGVTCGADGQIWATVQFERIDRTKGTLTKSSAAPRVTDSSSGSDCGDKTSIDQVRRLYVAYFKRESDKAGLAYWVSQISDGHGLGVVSNAFSSSPEFIHRYGNLSNRDFVRMVYLNVLGREPDEAGYRYWAGQMDNGLGRGELMIGFSESSEFRSSSGIS